MRQLAVENLNLMRDSHKQYPQKVKIWVGIMLNRIIRPFFIKAKINTQNYCNLQINQVKAISRSIKFNS